jgi:hypothetical protein
MIICKLCKKEYKDENSLGKHLHHSHKDFDKKKYYDFFIKTKEEEGKCFQCGRPTNFKTLTQGYYKYCSCFCSNLGEEHEHISLIFKGKTYDEIYGVEKAKEIRQKLSLSQNKRFENNEGKRFESYPIEFKYIRKKILKRDKDICQVCLKSGNVVHHIDYDKQNNSEENLITVCNVCNVILNYSQNYWITFFKLRKEKLRTLIGGIDFDSKKIAIVLFDINTEEVFSTNFCTGNISFTKQDIAWEHFFFYWESFLQLPIKKLYIEDPTRIRNITSCALLANAQGVLKALCWHKGIEFELVHPATWKKDILKNGGAKKEDINLFVNKHFPQLKNKEQDLRDAFCIGLWGLKKEKEKNG